MCLPLIITSGQKQSKLFSKSFLVILEIGLFPIVWKKFCLKSWLVRTVVKLGIVVTSHSQVRAKPVYLGVLVCLSASTPSAWWADAHCQSWVTSKLYNPVLHLLAYFGGFRMELSLNWGTVHLISLDKSIKWDEAMMSSTHTPSMRYTSPSFQSISSEMILKVCPGHWNVWLRSWLWLSVTRCQEGRWSLLFSFQGYFITKAASDQKYTYKVLVTVSE